MSSRRTTGERWERYFNSLLASIGSRYDRFLRGATGVDLRPPLVLVDEEEAAWLDWDATGHDMYSALTDDVISRLRGEAEEEEAERQTDHSERSASAL